MNTKPEIPNTNVFHYATRELSQDAMICWLLAWADVRNQKNEPVLHELGQSFVKELMAKHGKGDVSVDTIEISKQDNRIDILARINGKYVLLIENKTGSGEHNNQLQRYYATLSETDKTKFGQVDKEFILPTFIKTGNQSLAKNRLIEKVKFKIFERADFLCVFAASEQKVTRDLFRDFHAHLKEIEAQTTDISVSALKSNNLAIEGLYHELELRLNNEDIDWGHDAHDFLGLWWYFTKVRGDADQCYIQVQKGQSGLELGFRIECAKEKMKDSKWLWCDRFIDAGKKLEISVEKAHMGGDGATKRVAVIKNWLVYNGDQLDLVKTLDKLKEAEKILDLACKT